MVKISKNAKKILALTLAGVMTVGTVVPGSALSTVENVQAAETAIDYLNGVVKNEIIAEVESKLLVITETSDINKVSDVVKTAINNALAKSENLNSVEVKSITNALVIPTNPKQRWEGDIELTNGEKAKYSLDLENSIYTAEEVVAKINANDKVSSLSIDCSAVDSAETASKNAAKAASDALRAAFEWLNPDELDIVYKLDASESTLRKNEKISNDTWVAKYEVYEATGTDLATGTVSVKLNNYATAIDRAVERINNNISDVQISSDYWQPNTDCKDRKVAEKVVAEAQKLFTNEDGIKIEYSNNGHIEDDGTWVGNVKITSNVNGNSISEVREIRAQLVVPEVADVKAIRVVDNRTAEEKEVAINGGNASVSELDLSKLAVVITDVNGKDHRLEGTKGGFKSDGVYEVIADTSNYHANQIGKETLAFHVKNNTDKQIKFDVVKYNKYTIDSVKDLHFGTTGKALVESYKSSDENIIPSAVFPSSQLAFELKVYNKGQVAITYQGLDIDGKHVKKVIYDVNEKGELKELDAFATETIVVPLKTLGLNASTSSKVESENPYVATAEFVKNSKGEDCLAITSKGENISEATGLAGKTNILIHDGLNGKLTYKVPVTISKTGLVTYGNVVSPSFTDIQISDEVQDTLRDTGFYKQIKGTISSKGVVTRDSLYSYDKIADRVDLSSMTATVTAKVDGKEVTDTISFAADNFAIGFKEEKADLNKDLGAKGGTINIVYAGKLKTDITSVAICEELILDNDSKTLGMKANEVSVEKSNRVKAELKTGKYGEDVLSIKALYAGYPVDDTRAFEVKASNDLLTSTLKGSVSNFQILAKPLTLVKAKIEDPKFVAPTKVNYTIGDSIDLSGAKFTYKVDGNTKSVTVTEDMFDNLNTDKAVTKRNVVFAYGDYQAPGFEITVNPRVAQYTPAQLGINGKIKSVVISGDNTITATNNLTSTYVEVKATEINKKAVLTVTAENGAIYKYNVAVSEQGQISLSDIVEFDTKTEIVKSADLGITPVKAVSSDSSVVTAKVNGDHVVLTSVKPGTASITVTDKMDHKSTIKVTVSNTGDITIDSIDKYSPKGWYPAENGGWYWVDENGVRLENGWVTDNGHRYYIENGVTVYNDWKYFEEEGVWRYFNKWGLNVENGWYWVGKFCFFFRDGQMVENEWIKTNGIWSYVDKYGHALQNGWFKIDGSYYCFDKYGNMYTDTYIGKYYVNKWGAWDSRYDKK